MKRHIFISVTTLALCLSQVTYAKEANNTSITTCPSVSAITNVGMKSLVHVGRHKYLAGITSDRFDTDRSWAFGMGIINAKSQSDALQKANNSLTSLEFVIGPIFAGSDIAALCLYKTDAGYFGAATTPTIPLDSAMMFSLVLSR